MFRDLKGIKANFFNGYPFFFGMNVRNGHYLR